MKSILVPIDFSEYSRYAMEVALKISLRSKLPIKLLHVVEANYSPGVGVTGDIVFDDDVYQVYMQKMTDHAESVLKKYAEGLTAKGVQVFTQVIPGRAYSVIVDQFAEHEDGLIVLASKGISDEEAFLVGSTAEKVVRRSKVPVLTVKDKSGKFEVRNILIASDFADEVRPVLQRAKEFAGLFQARLHLLMVNTPYKFLSTSRSNDRLKSIAEEERLENYSLNVHYDESEAEGIVHFANQIRADIIAMGTHGRKGLAHLFIGSIAEVVLNHSSVPVLTYNIHAEKQHVKTTLRQPVAREHRGGERAGKNKTKE